MTGIWRARLGILVIHNDPVVETELWAMAPPGVTIHAARFESPTSTGVEYTGESWRAMVESPDIRRGLIQLSQLEPTAICLCFGSPSLFGGPAFDRGFTSAATQLAGGIPVYTAAAAIRAALTAARVHRPLVVMPPWFTEPTFAATRRYLTESGFDVAGLMRFELGSTWDDVRHHQLFDRGGRWVVHPAEVCRQVAANVPDNADGVLIPGSGFRSWEAIDQLERELDVPVVTSNQACLWQLLRFADLHLEVPRGGRVFTTPTGHHRSA